MRHTAGRIEAGSSDPAAWIIGLVLLVAAVSVLSAQTPPQNPPAGQAGQRGATPPAGTAPAGQRGGGCRGRGGVQIMTLSTTAWADGAQIPIRFAQPGEEVSPPLAWANAPDTTASFVLIVHDLDAPVGNGFDDVLHWMVWNIPGTSRGLPEGVSQGPQLADGSRQISVTGPYYRGPAAPATGPVHHYVFELFALDTVLDVPAVGPLPGVTPVTTRAAVVAAMAGHVRGKASMVGLFRRGPGV
jgi:Raf kinase inhibitor-like YbhB/YbcL family protein